MSSIGRPIEYVDIAKLYGGFFALKPTTLRIEAGEFFSIIGPSGSGKTTLLGLTAGFVAASQGRIMIGGESIEGVPPFQRNIGMVFQNYSLFPHKTVEQNIAFPLHMRHVPKAEIKKKVDDALRLVRLPDVGARYPGSLSGGQQQRIALARAAVYNPSLLIMDEPLSALDKNLREEMQYEIKQLHKTIGCTVLYVTHDQAEAAAMADRIAIMSAGEIVQTGSARELYCTPRNRMVASFLGQANLMPIKRADRLGSGLVVQTDIVADVKSSTRTTEGACCVCVRPEAITISGVRPSMDNVIRGIVMDAIFTNGVQKHRVAVGDRIIEQWQQLTSGSFVPSVGDEVYLGWSADDTLIVSDQ